MQKDNVFEKLICTHMRLIPIHIIKIHHFLLDKKKEGDLQLPNWPAWMHLPPDGPYWIQLPRWACLDATACPGLIYLKQIAY